MNYEEVIANAGKLMNEKCKACKICNGIACGFSMPGPGCKPPMNVAARNYEKWQDVLLNMDNIYSKAPIDTKMELFGKTFELPVIAAPIGGVDSNFSPKYEEKEYDAIVASACAENGIAASYWCGFEEEVFKGKLEELKKCSGYNIPAIKPFSNEKFKRYVDFVHEYHVPAIIMDIDGAGLPLFKALSDDSGCKNIESLRELREYANMPFILKGIMTVSGAKKALEAGFDTIVVSNHGGRSLSCVPSTAEVLEEICEAVGNEMTVLVDGGIRSGHDVFKAMALGAHGVLIGRPITVSVIGGTQEGVRVYLDKIAGELREAMEMCGAHSLSEIKRHMVRVVK